MTRKTPTKCRMLPEWMTMSAYSIMQMLLGSAGLAKQVLKIAQEMVDAAEKAREKSAA